MIFLFAYQKYLLFTIVIAVMNVHWAASARIVFFTCHILLGGKRVCGKCRGVDESHSIARSNLKLAGQKHDLFFCPSFLIQKMFALTLTPSWKHYFIMTQWINIHWEPWTMIGGLTILWKASLVWVEMRLLCETFFLSKGQFRTFHYALQIKIRWR